MNQKLIKELSDQIAREWSDKGMVIEGGWHAYVAVKGLSAASEERLKELRQVFFLGAQHLFGSLMSVMDPGTEEPTAQDFRRLDLIYKELEAFRVSVTS